MDLNKLQLIGNVGRDPEFHQMGNGKDLAKFSVATTRKWKDKNSGETREQTSWHNIVVFNEYLVSIVKQFVQKGTRVYVEGEVQTRSYEKDGETKYITEVNVPQVKGEIIVIARGKGWDDEPRHPADQNTGNDYNPATGGPPDEFDDDIPF